MRTLRTLSIAAVALLAPICVLAQANNFTLFSTKSDKPVGRATYTVDKVKNGTRLKSSFQYKLLSAPKVSDDPDKRDLGGNVTEAQMSTEFTVDANGNLLGGYSRNGATQMMTNYTPDAARANVTIAQLQAGSSSLPQQLPMPKPDFLVVADFDPGSMQILLNAVLNHPHADHLYLTLNPGSGARAFPVPLYIAIGDPTTAKGTLDGKPVELKAFPLKWNKASGMLYATEDGQLMQVDAGVANARYIRNKFTLDATTPAVAP